MQTGTGSESNKKLNNETEKYHTISTFKRLIYITIGLISLGLGVIGIFLPILPTTPFLLLSAWCFAKSSKRLYDWLHTNRLFGEYLRRYRAGEGITLKSKIFVITLLWATLSFSAFYAVPDRLWHVKIFLGVVGIAVTTHLLWIPTYRPCLLKNKSDAS